jgi:hypothetical protein
MVRVLPRAERPQDGSATQRDSDEGNTKIADWSLTTFYIAYVAQLLSVALPIESTSGWSDCPVLQSQSHGGTDMKGGQD